MEHLPGYVSAPIRARVAQIALVLHVAATAALNATEPVVIALYGEGGYREDGGVVDPLTHGLFSVVVFLLSIAVVGMAILTPIAVLAWLYRASKNAHAIATTPLEHSPAAAIGWWFVPFANLMQPLLVVRELETSSHPEGNLVASSDTSWWWGGYLAGNIIALFATDALHPSSFGMVVSAISTLAHAISAFMLIRIIERIRKNQHASSNRRRWADVFGDEDDESVPGAVA